MTALSAVHYGTCFGKLPGTLGKCMTINIAVSSSDGNPFCFHHLKRIWCCASAQPYLL